MRQTSAWAATRVARPNPGFSGIDIDHRQVLGYDLVPYTQTGMPSFLHNAGSYYAEGPNMQLEDEVERPFGKSIVHLMVSHSDVAHPDADPAISPLHGEQHDVRQSEAV